MIDSHLHLDDSRFSTDLEDVILRARRCGIAHMVTIGCWDRDHGFAPSLDIAERYRNIYVALAVHPHDASIAGEDIYSAIRLAAETNDKLVAVGETGLDYHYDYSPRDKQRDVFRQHLYLARSLGLPVIIHCREADGDTVDILRDEGAENIGGVFHCFSSDIQTARAALDMGMYISISGVVTFNNAKNVREVAKIVPIERLLLETDSPYLAPVPHRGKRNEPSFLPEVAAKIAEIKGLGVEDVTRITDMNTLKLFGIRQVLPLPRIAYRIRNSLYLNITNRCTNYCTFCAKYNSYMVKGHYLRLAGEPDFDAIIEAVGHSPDKYREIVFCGFGEPLIRLEIVKMVSLHFKNRGCRIRINTDGLANLVHGRNILPELRHIDELSVSINSPDSKTYQRIIKTPFGEQAFPAIVSFLKEAKKWINAVTASVVAIPGINLDECRSLVEDDIGVRFRIREYNDVG